MAHWEVFDGKDKLGPFTDEVLIDLIHKGLRDGIMVRRDGTDEWKPLTTHAPFALAIEKAEKAQPPVRRQGKPLGLVGGVALLAALLLVNTFWLGLGAFVDATCNVSGFGATSCLFTNRGVLPGSGCVVVRVARLGDRAELNSQRVCSSVLFPRGSASVESSAAFAQSPAKFCDDGERGTSWSDRCVIAVVPAP
jgi:hypothetical protein